MADQFRKTLELFYSKISNSPHLDVYKKILADQFDEVEVQPIHVLTLIQPPSYKDVQKRKKPIQAKRSEYLYKNSDFASVFLFGLILWALKKRQSQFLKELQDRVLDNLQVFYGQKQNQNSTRYKMMFTGLFQFCNYVITREYEIPHVQKLFKAFFNNSIERKGLKKNERQKYGTQAQVILSFILGKGGYFPSKNQVTEPTSDAYQLNGLDFCINIQNIVSKQEWTIGEGQNHINLTKQKYQYYITEQQIIYDEDQQESLDDGWLKLLAESQKIKQEQTKRTPQLLTDLNIAQCRSPTRSVKSPKSAMVSNTLRKPKVNNFI